MSPKNKKKLEAAIDNLFVAPQARSNGSGSTAQESPAAESPRAPESGDPSQPADAQPDPVQAASDAAPAGAVTAESLLDAQAPAASAPQDRPHEAPASASVPAAEAKAGAAAVEPTQAASGPDSKDGFQMVVFALDGQYYGIDIDIVESIIKLQAITKLPHVPHYNIGLTNLRGKVLPVFSLRRRFGLADQEASKNTRIIVIRLERGEAGLLVDEVSEVGTILRENIEAAPALATSDANRYIKGVARMEDRLVILPDLDRVIESAG